MKQLCDVTPLARQRAHVPDHPPVGRPRLRAVPVQERASAQRAPRITGTASEIAMLDGDGMIVVVNQAWRASLVSYGFVLRNAGIGARYADVACRFLPDLDRTALEISLEALLAGRTGMLRHTYAIRTPGGVRWRQVQITPLSVGGPGRFVATHDDLTDLAAAQAALQATSEQLLTARDEERQRIAIELHDSTGQHLAAISLGLARLRRTSQHKHGIAIIDEISRALQEAARETRALSYLMKPRGVADGGLLVTVRQFLHGLAQRTDLRAELDANEAIDRVAPPIQHAALRVVQEALLNASRHAQAQNVVVRMVVEDGQFVVSVTDDGRGMETGQDEPCLGVGIPGMQARVQQFGGQLSISSGERGTQVRARFPID